jgi:hypothetical protein
VKIIALILGVIAVLLGGLWLLQGLGVVRIEPIACVTACEALEGPSVQWAAIGLIVSVAGALAIWYGLRRRAPR